MSQIVTKQKYAALSQLSSPRNHEFDAGRDINPDLSSSPNSSNISALADKSMPTMEDLPPNWASMSTSDQIAFIFRTNNANTQSLHVRLDQLNEKNDKCENRVTELETEVAVLRGEVDQLKDLRVRGQPTCQLKITGIPKNCSTPLITVAEQILTCLKLDRLANDILDTRVFAPRASNAASQAGTRDSLSSSFIIRMKSHEICNYILDVKRKFGPIKISAVGLGNSNSLINIYEMLPQPIHELRLLAKSKTTELGHKYCWTRTSNVFVRREENGDRIPIVTEADIDRLQ